MFRRFGALLVGIVLIGAVGLAGPAVGQGGTQGAQVVPSANIIGSWSVNWQGARDSYAGKLDILRSLGGNKYYGKLTLLPAKSAMLTQEARITVNESQIDIECYNPSRSPYNPDRFFVTLSGNVMEGYSIDTAGQRGSRITFTKL